MKYEFFVKDLGKVRLELLNRLQSLATSLEYKTSMYFKDSKALMIAKLVDSDVLALLKESLLQLQVDSSKLFDVEVDRLEPFSYIG